MKFSEIASSITGFSTPVFGVSWNPPEPEVKAARRVIAFLEDKRVLYDPCHLEVEAQCVQSVLDIRRFLTGEIGKLGNHSVLGDHLRAIRAACRKVLRDSRQGGSRIHMPPWHGPFESGFFLALGDLRSTIGIHVAAIAVMHGLDVEGDLAETLPEADVDEHE
jgi:hypothetical protein